MCPPNFFSTAAKTESALGSVKGTASGGKKLEAETLAEGTLDFLKVGVVIHFLAVF